MQVGTRVDFPSQRPGKQRENSANPPKDRQGTVTPCIKMKTSLLLTTQIQLSEKNNQIPQMEVEPRPQLLGLGYNPAPAPALQAHERDPRP